MGDAKAPEARNCRVQLPNRLSDRLARCVDGANRELRFGHIKA